MNHAHILQSSNADSLESAKEQPLVSIIMAAYNAERYIDASIRSVLAQTYPNWELLVVNDGSQDSTENIVTSFSDPRIRYFTQLNRGVSAARNRGLADMRGSFFCFLDADDCFPSRSIAARVSFMLNNPTVDMLDGVVEVKDAQLQNTLRIYTPSFKGKPAGEYVRLNGKVFFGVNLFIRNTNEIYHFEKGMTHLEDLWFYTQLAWNNGLTYDFIDEVIYVYRKSENSAMSKLTGLEKGYWQFYTKVMELPGVTKRQLLFLRLRIVRIMVLSYTKRKQFLSAIGVFLRSLNFKRSILKYDRTLRNSQKGRIN